MKINLTSPSGDRLDIDLKDVDKVVASGDGAMIVMKGGGNLVIRESVADAKKVLGLAKDYAGTDTVAPATPPEKDETATFETSPYAFSEDGSRSARDAAHKSEVAREVQETRDNQAARNKAMEDDRSPDAPFRGPKSKK